jgi:pentatricopeptide repeat protein
MSLRGSLLHVGRHAFFTTTHRTSSPLLVSARTVPRRLIKSQGRTRKNPAEPLQISIRENDLDGIHQHYNAYTHKIWSAMGKRGKSTGQRPLSEAELFGLLHALAASGRPHDLALIEKVFGDMGPLFRIEVTGEIYTIVVRGLIRCGRIPVIYRWLMGRPKKTRQFTTIEHWRLFLEHCLKAGEAGMIRQSLKTMRQSGCNPTNDVFKILIRATFMTSTRFRDIVEVFDDALREKLPFDESVSSLVYDSFVELRRMDRAAQAQRLYGNKFPKIRPGGGAERNAMISAEAERGGLEAAIALCRVFENRGLRPNERTLTAVLCRSTRLADMRHAEDTLRVRANVVHWSILITNSVKLGDLRSAMFIYEQSQDAGIRPDVAMVQPIINALCYPPLARPDETAIDRALDIYQQLFRATSEPDVRINSQAQDPPIAGPNAQLYVILLRTLASSANTEKYFPKALALLDDMGSRDVAIESSIAVASVTILLMRSASSYADAVKIFKRISTSKHGPGLDAKGYVAILNAFSKIVYDRRDISPFVEHYFQIVQEMQQAGHSLTVEVYTIFLHQLGLSKTLRLHDMYVSVRKIHNRLVLDTSLSPDTALWNQLMNAYQRAGSFIDACRIWDTLFISNQYDNASVSIILDACAFANSWSMATNIRSKLFDAGFLFSQRNWNGWLECMCRLGRLDEAVKLMCMEMGKNQLDVAPDIESVRILLKFAKGTNHKADVQSYIKQYLPDLWESVPMEMRN